MIATHQRQGLKTGIAMGIDRDRIARSDTVDEKLNRSSGCSLRRIGWTDVGRERDQLTISRLGDRRDQSRIGTKLRDQHG